MSKKTYGLYAQQTGEGCDYTIGCGRNFYVLGELEEHEVDAAIRKAVEDHSLGVEDYSELDELALVVIVKDLDVADFMPDDDSEDEAREARRRQYEELKREFGD